MKCKNVNWNDFCWRIWKIIRLWINLADSQVIFIPQRSGTLELRSEMITGPPQLAHENRSRRLFFRRTGDVYHPIWWFAIRYITEIAKPRVRQALRKICESRAINRDSGPPAKPDNLSLLPNHHFITFITIIHFSNYFFQIQLMIINFNLNHSFQNNCQIFEFL